ncbi:hypothetical protein [Pelosinus baikalensis]|uniref:NlpC/P60 domain-containing protein n=1 Tax=Pelosinus baikalensis TaxID=2892015 RepID=A0ABS8HR48_9FIRM|nr:hypothetical protein [Pelosinus baikalensis]MCC5465535.1 hypothetical protein [Pelosinus baikalensis]
MTIEELIKQVGKPYEQLDSNGRALGCMLPVYLMYPHLPRFDWPDNLGEYMRDMFKKHLQTIELEDIKAGDLLLIRLPFGLVHPAVYIGNDEVIDCMVETSLQKSRLGIYGRIEGAFRCRV